MSEKHLFRQFLLLVIPLTLLFFAFWTFASAVVAIPAIGLDNMILTAWMPDIVKSVYVQGPEAMIVTQFGEIDGKVVPARAVEEVIGVVIDTRILSYSLPFYASLHFSTSRESYLADFVLGIIILYGLFVFGLVCLSLKNLMVALGAVFLTHPQASALSANVIALLYQFNVLLVPALAPILLWAWQNRESALLRGLGSQSFPGRNETR